MTVIVQRRRIADNSQNATHIGFGDESSWNQNRYRSIGLLTATSAAVREANERLTKLTSDSKVRELAWNKIRTAKSKMAGQKVIDYVVELAVAHPQRARVDVLIWDTHDSRHHVPGRDDTANLARMYYHLMSRVMNDRWPAHAIWVQFVDERTDTDWAELERCLAGMTRKEREKAQTDLIAPRVRAKHPPIVRQASSGKCALIQVADLFAGMAAFSWNETKQHNQWLRQRSGQAFMLEEVRTPPVSNSAFPKHELLLHITRKRLPCISLNTDSGNGLRTLYPGGPINFWKWEPQGGYDKAPLRNR